MSKGQTVLQVIIGVGGFALMSLIGWNSWLSLTVIAQSNQTATTVEWQKNTDNKLTDINTSLQRFSDKLDTAVPHLVEMRSFSRIATSSI